MASFTVARTALSSALSKSASVCKDRSSHKPILANVLLSVSAGRLSIAGTDLERYVKTEIECEGDNCQIAINAARLSAIVRSAGDEAICFAEKQGGVNIKCGRADWYVQTAKAAEFPPEPSHEPSISFTMPTVLIANSIQAVAFAASKDGDKRYSLEAICLSGSDSLSVVATNSRRVAACDTGVACKKFQALLPASAAAVFRALPSGGESTVEVSGSWLAVKTDAGMSVLIRLVEGRFPMWRSMFELPTISTIDLHRETILDAVCQSAITLNEDQPKLRVYIKDGSCSLYAQSREIGECSVEFPVAFDGEPIDLTLNGRYLAEMLRNIQEDSVCLKTWSLKGVPSASFMAGNCRYAIAGYGD